MKIIGKRGQLAAIARRCLALVGLLSTALICANSSCAQSSATTATAQDAKRAATPMESVQAPAGTAKPISAPARAAESAEKKPAAKSTQEGIKVHGHWTIEVKNPDGTVVKRVEFENALTDAGRFLIARDLLGRNLTVGTWGIGLSSASGTSPCTAQMTYRVAVFFQGIGRFQNACYIAESLANANLPVSDSDGNIQGSVVSGCQIPINCSNNLVLGLQLVGGDILNPVFTVSGSVVAAQSGTIDTVATFNSACAGSVSPANCLGSPTDPPQIFTQASLPSAAALGIPAQQPITVTLGQIISVTVLINFS